MAELSRTDQMLLERLVKGDVTYTYALSDYSRKPKLVRSSMSPSVKKHYERLALAGLCAIAIPSGCGGLGEPPETTITFHITALGRSSIGVRRAVSPPIHRSQPLTERELEAEGVK